MVHLILVENSRQVDTLPLKYIMEKIIAFFGPKAKQIISESDAVGLPDTSSKPTANCE